jgi:ComF family protein
VEHIVQGLKYRHRLPLAGWLAEALARRLDATGVDCIIPLPLSAQRMKERGFNQAQEIARPLARHRPAAPRGGLPARADSAPQASLPWKERQANIRQAFECRVDLAGKTIAVVDDVMTTGATLNEFARMLKLHGASAGGKLGGGADPAEFLRWYCRRFSFCSTKHSARR